MSVVGGGRVGRITVPPGGVVNIKKPAVKPIKPSCRMVEKSLDSSFPLNLPLQTDATPLGRLMEQYQRLTANEGRSAQEKLEVSVKKENGAINDAQYSQYNHYWTGSHNWWEAATAANWQALGYNMDNYAPYLNNQLNLLQVATNPVTSASTNGLGRLTRLSPTTLSSPGKYQRGNCECPNCMETERVGFNNMPMKKRGIHNCHFRGCGKVYNKSSHLKAHLRWHQSDRNVKPRKAGEIA